ncbi:MAG: TfuA-like protein [Acidimicrobiia bacterium]
MNELVIFGGPSLPAAEISRLLPEAVVKPPAAMGDVYRALGGRPKAIGIIDGYFERVPAPWHKELLWAMEQGVQLFGASSMGALRAVELLPFGMVGVGTVFEWFRDGVLEDDDEVAVAHLGPQDDFRPTTDAMVNIRATLSQARHEGVITNDEADQVAKISKALHYTERRWPTVLRLLERAAATEVQRKLVPWLAEGAINQKAADARHLLEVMAEWDRSGRSVAPKTWNFEHTTFWEKARLEIAEGRSRDDLPATVSEFEQVMDELRLDAVAHQEILDRAMVRLLASAFADARSVELRPDETQLMLDERRREMGLLEQGDVLAWLAEEQMDVDDLRTIIIGDTHLAWSRALLGDSLTPVATDVLRIDRRYGTLLKRAREKHAALGSTWAHELNDTPRGKADTDTDDGMNADEGQLLGWWFTEVHGVDPPDDLDSYLAHHRFDDRAAYFRAIRRERAFRKAQEIGS